MLNNEPRWPVCDVCGHSVTPDKGYLLVRMDDVNAYRKATAEFRAAHPDGVIAFPADVPHPAPWRWGHGKCLPYDNYLYDLAATDIDTPVKALAWILHLGEKSWLDDTDWREAFYRIYPQTRPVPASKQSA